MAEKEWYTIEELSDKFGVSYQKVRGAVQVLSKTNQIKTRNKPEDNRITEIHRDSIALVEQAAK